MLGDTSGSDLSLGADLMRGMRRLLVARRVRKRLPRALQPLERGARRLRHLLDLCLGQVRVFRVAVPARTWIDVTSLHYRNSVLG